MEFIKQGPLGEILYRVNEGDRTFFLKTNLSEEALKNYEKAFTLGIGPPCEINVKERTIKIEAGIRPLEAIERKYISPSKAITQVHEIQSILLQNKLAHCDVKFDNCFFFPRQGRIFLIDNGELTKFDKMRPLRTPGQNSTLIRMDNIVGKVEKYTDAKGFEIIQRELYRLGGFKFWAD